MEHSAGIFDGYLSYSSGQLYKNTDILQYKVTVILI